MGEHPNRQLAPVVGLALNHGAGQRDAALPAEVAPEADLQAPVDVEHDRAQQQQPQEGDKATSEQERQGPACVFGGLC